MPKQLKHIWLSVSFNLYSQTYDKSWLKIMMQMQSLKIWDVNLFVLEQIQNIMGLVLRFLNTMYFLT